MDWFAVIVLFLFGTDFSSYLMTVFGNFLSFFIYVIYAGFTLVLEHFFGL